METKQEIEEVNLHDAIMQLFAERKVDHLSAIGTLRLVEQTIIADLYAQAMATRQEGGVSGEIRQSVNK